MSELRDIGFLKWSDPLAWMEAMTGPRWKGVIRSEALRFQVACKNLVVPSEKERICKELFYASSLEKRESSKLGKVEFTFITQMSVEWKTDVSSLRSARDIAIDKNNVWEVIDSGEGAEAYEVSYWKYGGSAPVWSHKGVGPQVLVLHGRCYYLEAKKSLWYYRLVSVNAVTGGDRKVIYEETNPRWNLSLVRGAYMVRENSGLQEAFLIERGGVRNLGGQGFFVLGEGRNYLATLGRGTDNWQGHGSLAKWKLPKGTPESISVERGFLVTRSYGERSLWKCGAHEPRLLIRGICQIKFNDLLDEAPIIFTIPGTGRVSIQIEKEKPVIPHLPSYALATRRFTSRRVPYIVVQRGASSKGLLVVGYGAYGMSTQLSTARWYPLMSSSSSSSSSLLFLLLLRFLFLFWFLFLLLFVEVAIIQWHGRMRLVHGDANMR